jgi:membrane protein DedA with SNARE-associated domain
VEAFILRWGYLAVGLGTFFEGETILIAAGAMAHRGLLSLAWVIASAFVGSLAGDQLWFLLGRRYGPPFIAKRPKVQRRTVVVEGWLRKYGTVFVLGFRFLYGLRSVTPVLLGASRYAPGRFLVLNAVGAALWSLSFGYLGYGVGASLAALLDRRGRVEELLLAGVVVGAIVALASVRARRSRQRAAEVSAQLAERGAE